LELDLPTAWQLWFGGQTLDGDWLLWGLQIRWWGRIGQIVQLVSALAIFAEIVGAERLQAFGRSLHSSLSVEKLSRIVKDSISYTTELQDYMLNRSDRKEYERFSGWFPGLSMLIGVGLTALAVQFLYHHWWLTIIHALFFGGFFSVQYGNYIMIGVVSFVMFIGLLIDVLLIEPLAWIVDLAAIDKLVKIGSVVALLIGFHFSLLAS
jgi:hypothetical protein